MTATRVLRVGTRRSALARAQTDFVIAGLGTPVEIVPIVTAGDRTAAPIDVIGGTGVFVSALRDALLAVQRPFVEVHLSDPSRREPFRHVNLLHDIAIESIVGLGARGYHLALESIERWVRTGGQLWVSDGLKENRQPQRKGSKTSDSTMSKASQNEKVSSRNLGINRREGLRQQLLPQSSISLAGNGVRVVKVLNLEPLTDQKLLGQ
jgi:hypothetical protein